MILNINPYNSVNFDADQFSNVVQVLGLRFFASADFAGMASRNRHSLLTTWQGLLSALMSNHYVKDSSLILSVEVFLPSVKTVAEIGHALSLMLKLTQTEVIEEELAIEAIIKAALLQD